MAEHAELRPVVAIRALVLDAQGRLLLLKRANSEYGNGQWCLPGGKLDYGDTPENTVAKELREETQLAAQEIKFLFFQNSPPPLHGKMHCVNLYFSCTATGELRLNEENSAFIWVTPQEAVEHKPVFGAVEAIGRWMKG
jgi:8-oxo-dGTP diphosphatase